MSNPQLFCFSYAGGSASFFDIIKPELNSVEVIALEYPGHGNRHKEKCHESIGSLADEMLCSIKGRIKGKYALFGYSMGCIVLVEVLRRIIKQGIQKPFCVFLAAHEPHTKSVLLGYKENEKDEWVKNRTIKFGAVPERLINSKVFWRMYLPLYRSDYTIVAGYEFESLDLYTDISASIFYSETDTPIADMDLWKNYFVGECDYYCFEGNHFFINQHYEEIAGIINKTLMLS